MLEHVEVGEAKRPGMHLRVGPRLAVRQPSRHLAVTERLAVDREELLGQRLRTSVVGEVHPQARRLDRRALRSGDGDAPLSPAAARARRRTS